MEDMHTNASAGISRRTFISGSAIAGTLAALGLAGCAPKTGTEKEMPATGASTSDISWDEECEVLVVGSGYAGLAAAYEAAKAGAAVCHVDAAKGMVAWAKDNARLSGLSDAPIRWIVDDCAKFVEREIRRGKTYDAIIMDPPSYGRGPGGEVWKLEESLYPFVKLCAGVLSDKPLFVLINSYTTGLAPSVLGYLLHLLVAEKYGGTVSWDELGLPVTATGMALPCGATGRWFSE